jgi:hypothetical protein
MSRMRAAASVTAVVVTVTAGVVTDKLNRTDIIGRLMSLLGRLAVMPPAVLAPSGLSIALLCPPSSKGAQSGAANSEP